MARPSRIRRVLKWTWIGMSVLIPVAWIVSVFAGVRILTNIGSIAVYRGVVEIVQSPPTAEYVSQCTSFDAEVKKRREDLRKAEAQIPTNEGDAFMKPYFVDAARMILKTFEDGQASVAADWGIPIATTPGQSIAIIWIKPNAPRLARFGLGLRLPSLLVNAPPRVWPGVWIPIWVIALAIAVSWGIIRWRRHPVLPGHCMTCGYDLS